MLIARVSLINTNDEWVDIGAVMRLETVPIRDSRWSSHDASHTVNWLVWWKSKIDFRLLEITQTQRMRQQYDLSRLCNCMQNAVRGGQWTQWPAQAIHHEIVKMTWTLANNKWKRNKKEIRCSLENSCVEITVQWNAHEHWPVSHP